MLETQEFYIVTGFKYQSSNYIVVLSARTIINKRDAGLKGSFSSRISSNLFYYKLLGGNFLYASASSSLA